MRTWTQFLGANSSLGFGEFDMKGRTCRQVWIGIIYCLGLNHFFSDSGLFSDFLEKGVVFQKLVGSLVLDLFKEPRRWFVCLVGFWYNKVFEITRNDILNKRLYLCGHMAARH